MVRFSFYALLLCTFLLASCIPGEREASISTAMEREAESIRATTVPDRRIGVFSWIKDEHGKITAFETDHALAGQRVDSLLKAYGKNIPINMLPDPALGDSSYAVVRVTVANLRREPRHGAELVDQVILGTPLKVLKREGGWNYIQTPYNYLGWITAESMIRHDAAAHTSWMEREKSRVTSVAAAVYEKPDPKSIKLADLSMNTEVAVTGSNAPSGWSHVHLPDGRQGFTRADDLGSLVPLTPEPPAGWEIVRTATQFHGIPYLWGGNSSAGFDCSGFTQTVYRAEGYQLPRDANMQVEIGDEITHNADFSNVLPGDLLFFGTETRITHVGISLGGARFIHASTYVMMNSLLPDDADYSEYRSNTLQRIKRLSYTPENQ